MEELKNLVPVVFANQRVLTGKQIADFYGVEVTRIKDNFRKNKKRFELGVDYFKLEGAALRALKEQVEAEVKNLVGEEGAESFRSQGGYKSSLATSDNLLGEKGAESFRSKGGYKSPLATSANALVLYTQQGAARHCKMLNTPKAWEVFNLLMTNYFNPAPTIVQPDAKKSPRKYQPLPEFAIVYAVLFVNELTKIGMSTEFNRRLPEIRKEVKLDVKGVHSSSVLPFDAARKLEKACKSKFASSARGNELFAAPFADICKALDCSLYADKLIAIADKISDESTRDKILIHAANLLVGKEIF